MKWSQLKKRIEGMFADSVAGRVQVWNTRYRKSHDEEGEAWITIDKQRVSSMGTYTYLMKINSEAGRIRRESGFTDYRNPEHIEGYYRAHGDAVESVNDQGFFSSSQFNQALFEYLNLSFDEAIGSENPIIRAFAMLDRCFGKRRMVAFEDSEEHPLVKMLYRFRCEVEGIGKN